MTKENKTTKDCPFCKNVFSVRKPGGKPHIFCSKKCRMALWRMNNPGRVRGYCKRWRSKNPSYQKKWGAKNPERTKEYQRKYYYSNREKRAENTRKWRRLNPRKVREYRGEYRVKNKDRINSNWNKRYYVAYRNDVNFRLSKNIRNRIHKALKQGHGSTDTLRLLGVSSIEELKKHLEGKFQPGMSWENYAFDTWHVDHITALALFDLSREEEQRKAFHHTNLQPLWGIDNLRKGAKKQVVDDVFARNN